MDKWKLKSRPVCLEKRFEFKTYKETRDFLDKLGNYSEKVKRFPDISFGKTYVNITLRPEDEGQDAQISSLDHEFTNEIDKFVSN
tara:strand:- start:134 stop:388 length:255 start_codon:yes stop_codon:yes gene_type:complete